MNYQERKALREHAEAHYGEQHMTLTDWVKVIVGALIAAPILWATTSILLLL
jgi:hypothetical protein